TREYNFRDVPASSGDFAAQRPFVEWAATTGTDWATYTREHPGMSAFALEDGVVYHTYSAYARGLDGLWACTSGSTAPRAGEMRAARPTTLSTGFAATTSTTIELSRASPAAARGRGTLRFRRSRPATSSRRCGRRSPRRACCFRRAGRCR